MEDSSPHSDFSKIAGHRASDLIGLGLNPLGPSKGWTPPPAEELASLFSGYQIERLLGRGGMGAVYLARQVALERRVAIKVLPGEVADDPDASERFRREAIALARLSHPHIVPIFDSGQTETGLAYFVMEYVEGTGLDALIHPQDAATAPIDPERVLAIIDQVCDALAFAHAQGIVHRDLKPANVLIGQDGRARVADFGVARLTESESQPGHTTLSGAVIGTPDYMAPEQKRGERVDSRADIYALGVVLYEALCGETPQGAFDLPSKRLALPPKLDTVITRAIASRPEQRFQTTLEMKAALAAVRPAVARAQSRRVAPPARRKHRAWLVSVAVAVAGIGVTIPLMRRSAPASSHLLRFSPAATGAVPAERPFVNSLGMRFLPVPITGGPTDGQRVLFSIWATRVQDYRAFAKETRREWPDPGFEQGSDHPVLETSWDDAHAFCDWLTELERKTRQIGPGDRYRLPSDHEWSCAVGIGEREEAAKLPSEKDAKIEDAFLWGSSWPPPAGAANFAGEELQPALVAGKHKNVRGVIAGYNDRFVHTSPVGSFPANRFGLYDMSGNATQWCEDWYDSTQTTRVKRGASWANYTPAQIFLSVRPHGLPEIHQDYLGFRCVLDAPTLPKGSSAGSSPKAPQSVATAPTDPPALGFVATATKDSPLVNSLGMKFVPVPITGGPTNGQRVLFSVWETRVQDYEEFVKETQREWPHFGDIAQGPTHPAITVNWNDATAFCAWLTNREHETGRLEMDQSYRLPSDHEWSCAVGIGDREDAAKRPLEKNRTMPGVYPWGSTWPPPDNVVNASSAEIGNLKQTFPIQIQRVLDDRHDGYGGTAPVGTFPPNRLGIYDLAGNVWEWCADWREQNVSRIWRGGSWLDWDPYMFSSTCRQGWPPEMRAVHCGFRVVLAPTHI